MELDSKTASFISFPPKRLVKDWPEATLTPTRLMFGWDCEFYASKSGVIKDHHLTGDALRRNSCRFCNFYRIGAENGYFGPAIIDYPCQK